MKDGRFVVEKAGPRVGESAETMVQARIRCLGRFSLDIARIAVPALPTQKARALLVYLVAHRRADVARERLLELWWPEAEPDAARDGLRTALWTIRKSIKDAGFDPDDYLIANRSLVRWKALSWLDSETFLELSGSDDPLEIEAAVDLYAGDFLEGDYEEWSVSERARIGEAYERALSRLVDLTRSREAAQLLLSRNPYHEPSYALLIEDELISGRFVAAAALGERCERALAEVGVEPSERLKKLVAGIAANQARSAARVALPFVGREAEISKLNHVLNGSSGSTVLISGEAGIGKTALLTRAAEMAKARGRTVFMVRCFDQDSRPLGPLEDVHERLYGAAGLPASAVFTVDDVHTLSNEAAAVFAELVRQSSAHGLTIIAATRSEGLRQLIDVLSNSPFESIALGPLAPEDLQTAIGLVVPDGAPALTRAIYERSGGHPLFAAALLESLAQSGVLRSEKGTWRLSGAIDDRTALPKSLTTYIYARLRARGETASSVAAALALDPAATADDLIGVLEIPEEQVFNAIDDLIAVGVLAQPAAGTQLTFAHDLYREVSAATLNAGRRARLHRAFAAKVESTHAAESSLRAARHFALAGDALSAAHAYCRSAEEALTRRSATEARDRCAAGIAGLDLLERNSSVNEIEARLKAILARAQRNLGESEASAFAAQEAIGLAKRVGDSATAIDGALTHLTVLLEAFDAAAALESSREAAAMARETGDSVALSIALADESWSHRLLGDEARALEAASESQEIAVGTSEPDTMQYAVVQLIFTYVTWWRFADARQTAALAARVHPQSSSLARAHFWAAVAFLELFSDRFDDASGAIVRASSALEEAAREPKAISPRSPFERRQIAAAISSASARLGLAVGDYARTVEACCTLDELRLARSTTLASLFRMETSFLSHAELGAANAASAETSFLQDVFSGSRSPELAQTLHAAMVRAPDAQQRALISLDRIEAASRRMPLDADAAFSLLARAADLCGAKTVALRAQLRSRDLLDTRTLARQVSCEPFIVHS